MHVLDQHEVFFSFSISRSAHRTTNFTYPKFQFPEFKMLSSGFIFSYIKLYWHVWVYYNINSKFLHSENTEKVDKLNIRCKYLGFVLVV